MNIVGLSGSLRQHSSNHLLLQAVPDLIPSWSMQIYDGLAELPHFSPDLDVEPPPELVQRLRALLRAASGVIVSSPEYAHGIPGSLKNALDWLVSSGELMHKPVLVWSASPSGAEYLHPQLLEVLRVLTANVLTDASLRITSARQAFDAQGRLIDASLRQSLLRSLSSFSLALAEATTSPS